MNRTISAAALAGLVTIFASSVAHAEMEVDAEPTAPRDRPGAEPFDTDDDDEAFRIGALAGVGFPRPLAFEAMVKLGGVAALGLEYGFLPKTRISGVETRFWALAADARLFPFKNGFFIGMRGGHQTLSGTATADLGALGTYSESGSAETWFVNPRIGFLWTWKSGFTVGFDAGVQIPINPTLTTTLPAGLSAEADRTIASIANTFGNDTTPTIDLLRVGFLF